LKVALNTNKQTNKQTNKTRESDTGQKLSESTNVGARETEASGGVLPKEVRFTNIVPELSKTIED
jgi:hypothetical protein